jgi:hypothetical protein
LMPYFLVCEENMLEWVLRYWSFVDMSGYFGTSPLWT